MAFQRQPRLGVDIGRVLIATSDGGSDTSFLGATEAEALATPPMPGAFAALARLFGAFEGRVWIVSKCGPRIEARSRAWLDHAGFFAATGVRRDALRFCRARPDKALIARKLGLTHFVDDRSDVLAHMAGVVPHRFLFGPQRPRTTAPAGTIAVSDWAATEQAVLETLSRSSASRSTTSCC